MARHSAFNSAEAKAICGASMLPFRTSCKGPVNTSKVGSFEGAEDEKDIIDEAIHYYRANVLFRNYEMQGKADRLIVYLTLYISACLQRIEQCSSPKEAEKKLQTYAIETFAVPGQHGFPFSSFFEKPETPAEADEFKAYFKQLREETAQVAFSKRKFMNTAL